MRRRTRYMVSDVERFIKNELRRKPWLYLWNPTERLEKMIQTGETNVMSLYQLNDPWTPIPRRLLVHEVDSDAWDPVFQMEILQDLQEVVDVAVSRMNDPYHHTYKVSHGVWQKENDRETGVILFPITMNALGVSGSPIRIDLTDPGNPYPVSWKMSAVPTIPKFPANLIDSPHWRAAAGIRDSKCMVDNGVLPAAQPKLPPSSTKPMEPIVDVDVDVDVDDLSQMDLGSQVIEVGKVALELLRDELASSAFADPALSKLDLEGHVKYVEERNDASLCQLGSFAVPKLNRIELLCKAFKFADRPDVANTDYGLNVIGHLWKDAVEELFLSHHHVPPTVDVSWVYDRDSNNHYSYLWMRMYIEYCGNIIAGTVHYITQGSTNIEPSRISFNGISKLQRVELGTNAEIRLARLKSSVIDRMIELAYYTSETAYGMIKDSDLARTFANRIGDIFKEMWNDESCFPDTVTILTVLLDLQNLHQMKYHYQLAVAYPVVNYAEVVIEINPVTGAISITEPKKEKTEKEK